MATFCLRTASKGFRGNQLRGWRTRGLAMMPIRKTPILDGSAGIASPLGVAISQGDRATMSMVRDAITARLRALPSLQGAAAVPARG